MSWQQRVKKILNTVWREDIKIIAIFLLVIISLTYLYVLLLGLMANFGLILNTPAHDIIWFHYYNDTDGDRLIDIIEQAPEGQVLYHTDGKKIGTGTGTDPFDRDTDNDGFMDGAENNFGSNPNSWIDPGWIWILWALSIVIFYISRMRKEDMLKDYKEFEQMQQSGGVSGKDSGKFAYGTSTVFSKRVEEMSEEEKKEKVMKDARYQRMMGLAEPEAPEIKRPWLRYIVQFIIAGLIVFIGQYIINNF